MDKQPQESPDYAYHKSNVERDKKARRAAKIAQKQARKREREQRQQQEAA